MPYRPAPQDIALLGPADPYPVRVSATGRSGVLLVCDHAGRRVPEKLGDMGVPSADWDRHIAWDIGAAGVCAALALLLDCTCIEQVYSRLVIDCNRRPGHPTSIAPASDGTKVPANHGLGEAARQRRVDEIFTPYHAAIGAELDRRQATGEPGSLVAVHSFTPVMSGVHRPWHAGVLFNRQPAWSLAFAAELRRAGFIVGENEPYSLSDESDYTIPVHAEARALPYLELEIRQDLIAKPAGQQTWAKILATALKNTATAK